MEHITTLLLIFDELTFARNHVAEARVAKLMRRQRSAVVKVAGFGQP